MENDTYRFKKIKLTWLTIASTSKRCLSVTSEVKKYGCKGVLKAMKRVPSIGVRSATEYLSHL